jgi:glycosyltransferase involved in cell wall biosynthesis
VTGREDRALRRRTVVQYLDSDLVGGSERVLLQLLQGLDRTRWHPILLHHSGAALAELVEAAKGLGVTVSAVPAVTDRNFAARLPGLVRTVSRFRPAVFHAQLNWPLACKFGLLSAALLGVPAVLATVHLYISEFMSRSVRWQMRAVSRGVHRYLAVSTHVRDRLAALGLPDAKLRVVRNGVDPARFERSAAHAIRSELAGSTGRPIVLTAARLAPQKGLEFLLGAAAMLPEANFVIAGDGPDRSTLAVRAEAAGLADRVRFLGSRRDIPDLLAACDVFVLPSLIEGLPLSVLEAMAAARPVVATRVPGTDEAVVDGETGMLVPPRDPEALAHAIRSVLSNPERAARFGAAGRARVIADFSTQRMVAAVVQQYEELLER